MRLLLCLLLALHGSTLSAGPRPGVHVSDAARSVQTISAWLKESGRDGYLAADVADAAGIPRSTDEDLVGARQRGFRSGEVLRIAQVPADAGRDFLLFMVQRPDGEVQFYFATLRDGLKKAFVSFPLARAVVPMPASQAQSAFREELRYWEARAAGL